MAEEHIRVLAAKQDVVVAGIYSRTQSRAIALAKKYHISVIGDSVANLYEETKSDAVIIAVSELSAKQICFEAFKFPWILLVEKPLGYCFEEAVDITEEAERNNSKVFVALNRRQYSSTKIALAQLKEIEQPRLIHVADQQDPRTARIAGRPELVVSNWMYANSIHLVDYFKVFGRGEITSVEKLSEWNSESPDFVIARIKFSSGDIGIYEAIWNGPGPWSVTVTTQERRLELRPLETAALQVYGSRQLQPLEIDHIDSAFKAGFFAQAENLLKAMQGQPHNLVSAKEALQSMKLVKEIYA